MNKNTTTNKTTSVRFDAKTRQNIDNLKEAMGSDISKVIREAVEFFVSNHKIVTTGQRTVEVKELVRISA